MFNTIFEFIGIAIVALFISYCLAIAIEKIIVWTIGFFDKCAEKKVQSKKESSKVDTVNEKDTPEYKAKNENVLNKFNRLVDEWVNKVLDDGVISIYEKGCTIGNINYYYVIETQNYTLQYWHQNLYYSMANHGEIKTKDNRILCKWESQGISKETRYRLYQIEESMKEIREDKQIPVIYPKTKQKLNNGIEYDDVDGDFNDKESW